MIKARWLKSKRYWTWIVLGVLAISIMGPVVWIVIPKPGINRLNFHKIQIGMTVDEVTALMGHPPGLYADPRSIHLTGRAEGWGQVGSGLKSWGASESGFIMVHLDENNHVCGAQFYSVQDDSFLGRLLGPLRGLFGL
jgi:hypothetical protein